MKSKKGTVDSISINTELFRTMLAQKGINQRKLAKELGLDPASVSNMLNGKRKIQLAEAKKIAEVLNVQLSDVLLAAGIQALPRLEAGGLQEALRRLMEHANAHMMECVRKGNMATADVVMNDIKTAMTLLDTMMTSSRAA